MLPCGSMRGTKETSEMGHHVPLLSCVLTGAPWVCEFVMCVLFLQIKHFHDKRSTGKYQLMECAACLPSSFAPEFSSPKQFIIRKESNDSASVQQHLALHTSSIHQTGKSACNKQKYFLTQIQAFYELQASF